MNYAVKTKETMTVELASKLKMSLDTSTLFMKTFPEMPGEVGKLEIIDKFDETIFTMNDVNIPAASILLYMLGVLK
jgi:hypothetical protein